MKKIILAAMLILPLAACTSTERGATIGAVSGAAIGGIATGDVGGAVVGGALGGIAGAVIGQANEPGYCWYRDRHGRRYKARC